MGATVAPALALPPAAGAQAPLRFTQSEPFIEINAQDGDAGCR